MSLRDLFRRTPAEALACSFCRAPRAAVRTLVAGPGVSICEACVVLAGAISDEATAQTAGTWARIVEEMAATCLDADAPRVLEPLTRAAVALCGEDLEALRRLATALFARQSTPFARATLIVHAAIGKQRFTPIDAEQMLVAALLAGDLELAASVRPVSDGDASHPLWILNSLLVPLVRARRGEDVAELVARVAATVQEIDDDRDEVHAAIMTTLGLAELRLGRATQALAHYAELRDDPRLRPWHILAIGDALHETGDASAARTQWTRIASDPALETYWCEQARMRLERGPDPYRS